MNVGDLREDLEQVMSILLLNKQAVTETSLNEIEELVEGLSSPEIREMIRGWDAELANRFENLLHLSHKFVEIERILIRDGFQDRLYRTIGKVKNSPLILRGIAMLFRG